MHVACPGALRPSVSSRGGFPTDSAFETLDTKWGAHVRARRDSTNATTPKEGLVFHPHDTSL